MSEIRQITKLTRARLALDGLSVGDAFGDQFFLTADEIEGRINQRDVPNEVWEYTDDTAMALSIYMVLQTHGRIVPELLAADFAASYDQSRGYGPAMHRLLGEIKTAPHRYKELAAAQFGGRGSFGNGSAMRVAPLGAYFADDMSELVDQAELSSLVTHSHLEGVAGAISVAAGAAVATNLAGQPAPGRADFLNRVISYVPDSEVKARLILARDMDSYSSVRHAVAVLGNGIGMSAQDTVPFSLWCAGECLDNFEDALWLTVSGLGDRDTTCAIVGGIVSCYVGSGGLPENWLNRREPLPIA
jgi:ADP-ribosylglycohydrolase